MEFIAADGSQKTGEVWSPGPEARSVWVLLEDGTPVAVKLPSKHCPDTVEIPGWDPRRRSPILAPQWQRLEARHAPKLAEKLWREALA